MTSDNQSLDSTKSFVYNTFYFLVKNGSGPIDTATRLSFDAVYQWKERRSNMILQNNASLSLN